MKYLIIGFFTVLGLTFLISNPTFAKSCTNDSDCNACYNCSGIVCKPKISDPDPACDSIIRDKIPHPESPQQGGQIQDKPKPGTGLNQPSGNQMNQGNSANEVGPRLAAPAPPPPPVISNYINAEMANTNGVIKVAYSPAEGGAYQMCEDIPKTDYVKIRCAHGGTAEGKKSSSIYWVWKDGHSVRFQPEDGLCDLAILPLNKDYQEGVHANSNAKCKVAVGAQGVQVVLGPGTKYRLAIMGTIIDQPLTNKKLRIVTTQHPSQAGGSNLFIVPYRPGEAPKPPSGTTQ